VVNVQGETQDVNRCEVADDAVVVSKVRPMKASNGVEDKTGMTNSKRFVGVNK